ncbi:MAG: MFS transporter [Myxococcales bacterium]|nr:MAG: MFS transporter [Myxococcales bacterium]
MAAADPPSRLSQLTSLALRPFGEVRPREVVTTLSLTATVFVILMAYYLLKVVREPLILMGGGAAVKSYAAVGQAGLLIVVSRVYAWLVQRLGRMPLTAGVFLTFTACVLGFLALSRTDIPIGVPFYLFVGIFSLTIIAQFWSFANDIHTHEQGKRLFAVVGIGSSVGAVAGSALAKQLFKALGVQGLLGLAAGFLVLSLGGLFLVDRMRSKEDEVPPSTRAPGSDKAPADAGEGKTGWRKLVALVGSNFDRYLWLIAAMLLLLNAANSNGEYILDRTLVEQTKDLGSKEAIEEAIATFKGSYFSWFNGIGLVLQLFVTSRLIKVFGLRVALFIFPIIALGGNIAMLIVPLLPIIKISKVAENSVDYSIQATANQALYLVTSREQKYAAKNFIDTFVVRVGDVVSAGIVLVGTKVLDLSTKSFIAINIVVIGLLLFVVLFLGRENTQRAAKYEKDHPDTDPSSSKPADPGHEPARAGT